MSPFLGEVIGTMLLILLGGGGVANVLLGKSKGNSSGWIVIFLQLNQNIEAIASALCLIVSPVQISWS